MKYCTQCGSPLDDHSVMCPGCGHTTPTPTAPKATAKRKSALLIIAMVFMIVRTVILGFMIFPLAWCLPMTITYCSRVKNNQPVSTGFKVCALIFVDLVAGILMLCDHTHSS